MITNVYQELDTEQRQTIEGVAQTHARDFEAVVSYAATNPDVDVSAICDHYIDTLVSMMMPRSVAVQMAALYVKLEDAKAHLREDDVGRITAEIKTLKESGYDLVDARISAITQLRGVIASDHVPDFDRHVGFVEQPKKEVQPKTNWFGDVALRSVVALRTMFATQS